MSVLPANLGGPGIRHVKLVFVVNLFLCSSKKHVCLVCRLIGTE